MLKARYFKHILQFKNPSGTSRGILKTKEAWFIVLEKDSKKGYGECGLLRGLSMDDRPDYEDTLSWVCQNIHLGKEALYNKLTLFPSIQIAIETAFISLEASNPFQILPSSFSQGNAAIPINGLIWMGDKAFMKKQIKEKLKDGFSCIKMKIGAIDFNTEIVLLKSIRSEFTAGEIELRVDANGAFKPENALEKLKRLSELELHSIEQPIAKNQWEKMARLCASSPLAIALDEELIGITDSQKKTALITEIKPQYIILKPSFIGGFQGSDDWISIANKHNVGWWITSALESNVGLNAICQYTYAKNTILPQGLGTGSLYLNNIKAPLQVAAGAISYNPNLNWDTSKFS